MSAKNSYATSAEYKAFITPRGQTSTTDTADDAVITRLLETASRYIDGKTGRWFYPSVQTRYYDIPGAFAHSWERELLFNADLLAVLSFLNGDGSSIASTEYQLMPKNASPAYGLRMKQSTTSLWLPDSNGNTEDVISVNGIYGYHNRYSQEGWRSAGTLNGAINSSITSLTMASGHSVVIDKLYKIDNELLIPSVVASNAITLTQRGDNGSTAASHVDASTVYEWHPMEELRDAVCAIVQQAYKQRFGQSANNAATVTAAGVVLTPKDIPTMAADFMKTYRRRILTA